jgi:hypothetical protein
MTAMDIAQLTRRVTELNHQYREIHKRLELLLVRVEKLILDDGALREDLDRLYLHTERAR